MNLSVPEHILKIDPYVPGKPLEELEREYGIKDSIKLASNENPLGPSPKALEAIQRCLTRLHRYPDGSGYYLIKKLSEKLGLGPENIVLGCGSDEIIGMLSRALLQPGDEVLLPTPSFLMYEIMVRCAGACPTAVPLKSFCVNLEGIQKRVTNRTRMVFICNPNNPTGTIVTKKAFTDFMASLPSGVVAVVDEAYIEFVQDRNCLYSIEELSESRPVVTLRTFSKAYGLAGLRIGYGVMPAAMVDLLNRVRQPFNTNSLAQVGAAAALDDTAFLEKTVKLVHQELDYLYGALDQMAVSYFPTQTNFFLIDVRKDANQIFEGMLRQGVIVRSMSSYGYPRFIRINVGLHEENVRFIRALKAVL